MAYFFIGGIHMIKKLVVGSIQENCYIISHSEGTLLVDPGDEALRIIAYLKDHHLKADALLITHGHFDHIGAIDKLYAEYGCPIYAHSDTIPVMHDGRLNLLDDSHLTDAPVIEMKPRMKLAAYDIMMFETPGHCQGCCIYYIKEEEALFTGDTLFCGSVGRYDFPTSSFEDTMKSMHLISALPFDAKVYPGHGPETTLSKEKMNNPYLDHII